MANQNYVSPISTLIEYSKLSNTLLYKVNLIHSIDYINMWKSDAQILVYKYKMLLNGFDKEIEVLKHIYKKEDEEYNNLGVILRFLSTNPAQKVQFKIEQMKKSIQQIHDVINKLEYWINIVPESIQDAKQLTFDLKLYRKELTHQLEVISQKEFDIDKFNVTIKKYNAQNTYQQFQRTFVDYIKQKNIKNVQEAQDCIHKLLRIVDETINWYENFLRRG